ncbi:MAG TPA: response regulator transcription factor [Bryobacteraceae bacterium]|nr:response regulator transcription factor [Bryobacteraceae bacterium]
MGREQRAIRILIADEQGLFRHGLKTLLSAESDLVIVGEASDAEAILPAVERVRPDVLVVDLALVSGANAHTALAARQAHPAMAILFTTREDGPEQLEAAMSLGARGYMLRASTPVQFVTAVRSIGSGANHLNPQSLSQHMADLQALSHSHQLFSRGTALTQRETEIVKLLAEGQTVREVAAVLQVSVKTVEAHKLNLMRKLNIHNRAALIDYAVIQGIVTATVPARPLNE